MRADAICGNCVHYPLCYGMWHVQATNPCKHIVSASLGFFQPKSKPIAPEAEIALRKALQYFLIFHSHGVGQLTHVIAMAETALALGKEEPSND